jgi:hypothetical protein
MHPAAAELDEEENVQPAQRAVATVKESTASILAPG